MEMYRERKAQAQPEEKDMELFRFAAGRVRERRSAGIEEENLEEDAEKLLAYILEQEEGRG